MSFYFNHLSHFPIHLRSLSSTCCYFLATRSHHSMQLLFHSFPKPKSHTPLFTPTCQQNCSIPFVLCNFPRHLFFTTPLSYQHTLQLFCLTTFSLDVFSSLPSNHTNWIAASITEIVIPFAPNIITTTFTSNRHWFSHFRQPSVRHFTRISPTNSTSIRPTFLIFTLIIFMLLFVIMF